MAERRPPHTPPSAPDGDGVRVVPKPGATRRVSVWAVVVALLLVAGVGWWLTRGSAPGPEEATPPELVQDETERSDGARAPARPPGAARADNAEEEPVMPSRDPEDLANYFSPGDPEPTAGEVIRGLQAAGVRTGLGAFNPPGTSPPLEGLAVPEDFPLPDGYVRHHQVTDEGVPIEPILMFAPDAVLYDADGRPIVLPENRVVPPALAPPGLPLRWVRIGKP